MIKKLLLLVVLLIIVSAARAQTPIEGSYMVGDKKAVIQMDDYVYYVTFEGADGRSKLQYEENTPENDQIWLVWNKGFQRGTFVFKSDYTSGMYTDYLHGAESYVKKIQ